MKRDRFRKRRAMLREKKLCTRCGEEPARPGHCTCTVCAAVMVVKDELRRKRAEKEREAIRRKLAMVHQAEEILNARLNRLSAA